MGEQQNADEALLKLNQDIFGKTGNGTLDFSLASTPDWEHHPNEEVLNVDIHDMDFNAIHVDALRSKNIKPFPTHSSVSNWECQKNRSLFVNAFPECPYLVPIIRCTGRIVFSIRRLPKDSGTSANGSNR